MVQSGTCNKWIFKDAVHPSLPPNLCHSFVVNHFCSWETLTSMSSIVISFLMSKSEDQTWNFQSCGVQKQFSCIVAHLPPMPPSLAYQSPLAQSTPSLQMWDGFEKPPKHSFTLSAIHPSLKHFILWYYMILLYRNYMTCWFLRWSMTCRF